MSKKILYVVNNDSTTSVPLEVAAEIRKQITGIKTIVYYKESPFPPNPFIRDITNINAKSFLDPKGIRNSIKIIKKTEPDVIHAHHTLSTFVFFILAKIFCPAAKLIKTVHTSSYSFRWDQKIMNYFIYFMADDILCNSNNTRQSFSFLEKAVSSGKTSTVYNGVNIKRIRDAGESGGKNRNKINQQADFLIGSVGRLEPVKDYKTLIKAFEAIRTKSKKDARLLLIGDGKERDELEAYAASKNLERDITFTGAIDRNLVYNCLYEIDIFVITSLHEGFCNTLVEAMAAGKAIVSSNIATLKEVAGDSVLYGESGKPKTYADKILDLIEDEELMKEMRIRAYERAQMFTLEECAKRYMEHYV